MSSGELSNCPGCRRACPADQLTCDNGRGIFADIAAEEEAKKRKASQKIRPFFPDTEARLAEEEAKAKKANME